MDDITRLSAQDLARLIRTREISCREVVETFLAKIETHDRDINAFCTISADLALMAADDLDRSFGPDQLGSRPLFGLPIALKDLTPTAGIRTTRGSRLFEHWIPDADADLVRRLKQKGAIVIGKTNTPEFGHKAVTDNAIFGSTSNPWDISRVAGGSSGGSAAAVVAGLVPFAEGSDGAGSLRIPASLCGAVGFKPTFGRVPDVAQSFFSHSPFLHNGPIARTVGDAALLYRAMAGPEGRSMYSVPDVAADALWCKTPLSNVKLAFCATLGLFPVRKDVLAATKAAAGIFQSLGCHVEEFDLVLPDETEAIFMDLWCAKLAGLYGDLAPREFALLDPVVQGLIEQGRALTMMRLGHATKIRDKVWQEMCRMFASFDALICPTTAVTAFHQKDGPPSEIDGHRIDPLLGWVLTYPFNLTGHPVISVPCGRGGERMPVGLQIVGRRFEDDLVLDLAEKLEAARPWPQIAETHKT